MFKLEEQKIDSSVVIILKHDGKEYNFNTKIKSIIGNKVYLKSINLREQILFFDKFIVELMLVNDGKKPIVWEECRLETIKDSSGEIFYQVFTNSMGFENNRRNCYRVFMNDNDAIVLINGLEEKICANIYDMSASGISFFVEKKENLDLINKDVTIVFKDEGLNHIFQLKANVVRKGKGNHKDYFGCEFTKLYEKLESYLMLKQREELMKRSPLFGAEEIKKYKNMEREEVYVV